MAESRRIGTKLVVGSGVWLFLFVASGTTAYRAGVTERAQLDRAINHAVPAMESIERVRGTVAALRQEQQRTLVAALSNDRAGVEASMVALRALHAAATEAVKAAEPHLATAESRARRDAMAMSLADWRLAPLPAAGI